VKKRANLVAFTNGFHGLTQGSLAVTGNNDFRDESYVSRTNATFMPFDGYFGDWNTLEYFRKFLEDTSSGIDIPAAVIVETIQGEGGINLSSAKWLQELESLCREYDILLIIDDIQVGSGRTGNYFSFDGMDLDPDIVVLAKGIGGFGTPLAMTLNKPEWDEHWSPGEHTGTFRGQGISFVAGKVGIEYFKDQTFGDEVKTKGTFMQQTLLRVVAKHPELQLRGKGMIWGMDFGVGEPVKAIAAECFQNGLVIGACSGKGEVLKFIPPLTIPQEELECGLKIFEDACDKILGATQ
jgi:diaminobutyrate-2-oxoglutarate transaminase